MNDSNLNPPANKPWLLWLFLLWFALAQQCAYRLSPLEAISAHEIATRRQTLQALMPLVGEGQVNCEYLNRAVSASFNFYYHSIDSLQLLIFDPLGRHYARVELYGDGYYVHLLRENLIFSGSQPPALLQQYLPLPLTAANLRNLLLGLPFNPAEGNSTMQGRYINHKTGLKILQIPESLSIQYNNFKNLAGVALAQHISLKLPSQKLEASLQLTKIQSANLKLSGD